MKHGRISTIWLAGLFDGDCTMTSSYMGKYPSPRVSFTQKDFEVVIAVYYLYGGTLQTGGSKDMTYLTWTGKSVKEVLTALYPHLIIKKRRAGWMLEMVDCIGVPAAKEIVEKRTHLHELIRSDDGALESNLTISRQWLAGFVEADGTIVCAGKVPSPRVMLAQKDTRILYEIQRRYGGALQAGKVGSLTWTGNPAIRLLEKLFSHLRMKHHQAAAALEMGNYLAGSGHALTSKQIGARKALANKIKELNHGYSRTYPEERKDSR